MSNHLSDALLGHAADPDRPCLIRPDGRQLSYAEVGGLSGRYAAALHALGVRPGDRVAAQVEKSPEALLLYLGCIRAGAVFLPLNPAYTIAELDYFIGDAEPALLVGSPAMTDALRPLVAARDGLRLQTLGMRNDGSLAALVATRPAGWTDAPRSAGDLAAILYTSGTTGRAKGAMLSHGNLRSNAEALVEAWRFGASDTLVHALPIFHTHGLFVATNVALAAGAAMVVLPKFDPAEIFAAMRGATVLMGVPTFYTRLLDEPGLGVEAVGSMRLFTSGSAPLRAETHRAFQARTGHAILERYGMTETGMNTSNPYDGERLPGSVGLALPGIEVRIADAESGASLPSGAIGQIEVRGPNVFSGYWRMPDKTRAEFRPDGFFKTGDLGALNDRGYLWISGRDKDLVITGGFNVYPKEVELALDAVPGVAESAVIGVPHPDFGEAVAAVVVPEPNTALDEAAVIGQLRTRLAGYKLPKRILFAAELPRNAMAKVQKSVLRERYATLFGPPPPQSKRG